MKELSKNFEGKGEVRNFFFKQVECTVHGYIYKVSHPDAKKPHYEAFRRKVNERFQSVSYPKSTAFGRWAWTCTTLAEAREKLAAISKS